MLGREHLISREEVERLQGLRGMYGIAAPAPLCADPGGGRGRRPGDRVRCSRRRMSPEAARARRRRLRSGRRAGDGEIRLTYGELTALIADAVRTLRD